LNTATHLDCHLRFNSVLNLPQNSARLSIKCTVVTGLYIHTYEAGFNIFESPWADERPPKCSSSLRHCPRGAWRTLGYAYTKRARKL